MVIINYRLKCSSKNIKWLIDAPTDLKLNSAYQNHHKECIQLNFLEIGKLLTESKEIDSINFLR